MREKKKTRKNFGMTLYLILISFLLYFGAGLISVIVIIIFAIIGVPMNEDFYNFLYMFAFIIFIGTLLSAFFSRYITRPFQALNEATKKVAAGDFNVRIQPKGPREAKELAENFNKMARQLDSTETLRNDFISNVSHEFKTPVASIKGFAKLAKKETTSAASRREYLDFIIRESDRLATLTGNVLLLSRLEKQEIAPLKNKFLLDEQLRRAALLLEPQWHKKNIGISTDLITASYEGYEELLIQVWINLIGNAVKFTPEGGNIGISMQEDENKYIIKISDSGIGMNDETISHVFDKFFQGDKSHSSEGNGLGLSLVKQIVEMSRGELSIESEPENGTIITVFLPKYLL